MKTFKSTADLAKLPPTDPTHAVIQDILADFPRDPDIHGYVVLVEQGDTRIDLPELKGTLANMSWDGAWLKDGHYRAVYLTNNEFALEFVVPDADWLDAAIRASLEAHAGDWVPYVKAPPF
jgi:hypothetical protein